MIELKGTYTAIVTPFSGDNVNEPKFRDLVEMQIAGGVAGIIPVGTTGESPTLSHEEHRRVVDIALETVNGRIQVIAGTGSNNTIEAVSLTRHAQQAGADAALLITPYYNRPSQTGLIRHYKTVAESCDIPLIIYNCPGRTAVNTTADTVMELAEIPNIVGIKEASGNMDQICEVLVRKPEKFTVLSGDDSLTVPMISVGAMGVISVISNIVPDEMSKMTTAALSGDFATAAKIHTRLFPLMRLVMKAETSPSPIKSAMNLLGIDVGSVRLPLVEPGPDSMRKISGLLESLNLIP
jgi:4-hydroxy-tetrahydrodipicolinate synthase